MGKIIVITSGKGGVGKSTASVGIATALCTGGKKVLLIDTDEGLRCLDMLLNVSNRLVFDMSDVINGGADFTESLLKVPGISNLYLLAASNRRESVSKAKLADLIIKSSNEFDYVIVDSPAGTDMKLNSCLPNTTEFFVVCNTDPVCLRDAVQMSLLLSEISIWDAKLIINRFDYKLAKKQNFCVDSLIDTSGIMLSGIVPEDIMVQEILGQGKPFVFGNASRAFYRIAARIDGDFIPLPNLKKL